MGFVAFRLFEATRASHLGIKNSRGPHPAAGCTSWTHVACTYLPELTRPSNNTQDLHNRTAAKAQGFHSNSPAEGRCYRWQNSHEESSFLSSVFKLGCKDWHLSSTTCPSGEAFCGTPEEHVKLGTDCTANVERLDESM